MFMSVLMMKVWLMEVVKGVGELTQTTATLPLAIARSTFEIYEPQIIPKVNLDTTGVQKDLNEYFYSCFVELDKAVTEGAVTVSETPPTDNVVAGSLWYDSGALELNIYYVDDDSAQWVPTSVAYSLDDQLLPLETAIANETRLRESAIQAIYQTINSANTADAAAVNDLSVALESLKTKIETTPEIDLSSYITVTNHSYAVNGLTERIVALETAVPDHTALTSKAEAAQTTAELEELIAACATKEELAITEALIPAVDQFVTQNDIDTSIAGITTEYLPRTGGTLTGSFQLQKNNYSLATLDFSGESWYGKNAFKFKALSNDTAYSTFGTTENEWEYAWDFRFNEDFCWIYNDATKVFSITKDGPRCSQLYLGDFTNNNSTLVNKIDVKDRLIKYQEAFENLRQGVSNATDFDSLKASILSALTNV